MKESYDKLILSMGAEPVVPPIEGIARTRRCSRCAIFPIPIKSSIISFEENHPTTAVVVGGGYIGVEMAENLYSAGLDVTMVEMLDQVIAPLDYDMAADVHRHIVEKGVDLRLKTTVKAVAQQGNRLQCETGQWATLPADMVILAIGVQA